MTPAGSFGRGAARTRRLEERVDELCSVVESLDRRLSAVIDPDELWNRLTTIGEHIEALYDHVTRHEKSLTTAEAQFDELRHKINALRDQVRPARASAEQTQ